MSNLIKRVKQTEINGHEYQIYLLRASDGLRIAQKLSTIVASMFEGTANEDGEMAVDFGKIAKTISTEISEKDMNDIIGKLLKDVTIDGRGIDFEEYFSGNYGELFQAVSFALQENFGSFFDILATQE